MTTVTIEDRPYGPESTPAEVEAIRARVRLHDDGIVLYHEIPIMTHYSIDLCYDRVEELLASHGCAGLIVDISEAGRPDAAIRKHITNRIARLEGRVKLLILVMSANPLIQIAARFIKSALSVPVDVNFAGSVEEAEQELRRVGC